MATRSVERPTQWDHDVNLVRGKAAPFSRMLMQKNPILMDLPAVECNLDIGHKTVVQTGLPDVWNIGINEGLLPTKGTSSEQTFEIGTYAALGESDANHSKVGGKNRVRVAMRIEAQNKTDALNNDVAKDFFYGNPAVNPNKMRGISGFYNDRTSSETKRNIINANGSAGDTDLQSIWVMGLGKRTIYGIYPKGSQRGLQYRSEKNVTTERMPMQGRSDTGIAKVHRQWFDWRIGLAVQDWRYAARVCNIKLDDLVPDPTAAGATDTTNLIDLIHQAINQIQDLEMGGLRSVIYCSRRVYSMLSRQDVMGVKNSTLDFKNLYGRGFHITCQGIPVHRCDALNTSESYVA